MKNLSLLQWVLLLPALLLLALSLLISALVLSFAPPLVSWVAVGVFAVVVLWFVLVRRRGSSVATEGTLLASRSTKEGLL